MMTGRELVTRAIEFETPERLPFWQHVVKDVPDDVCDCWEMDRAEAGWFFDQTGLDDWGCVWERTDVENIGQVKHGPLEDWSALDGYRPPNPMNPYYFERLENEMTGPSKREGLGGTRDAFTHGEVTEDSYVVVTCHFNLFERLHMLHGFQQTMLDFYVEPKKIERVLDMVLDFKIGILSELHRRFGDRVHGIFMTDDWGSQKQTFISGELFEHFFAPRYKQLNTVLHSFGYHSILHSCGKVNDFVQRFIDCGFDVLNLQQPRNYGIEELGKQFAGKICFLTTVDIQKTLPTGTDDDVREEAKLLVDKWSTPEGGFIVFNYGDGSAIGTKTERANVMFTAFAEIDYPCKPNE